MPGGMLTHMMPMIRPADRGEVAEATHRLGLPESVPAEHLLVAVHRGRLVGAIFAEVTADGLAELRPPAADDRSTAEALAVALMDRLGAERVGVAQCLLAETDAGLARPLLHVGFRQITQLVTLRREPASFAPRSAEVSIVPIADDNPDLIATFAASLAGSHDMPELTGARPPAVELAGYLTTDRFLARLGRTPVGLSLLTPGEVLYLGLVPSARGRGYGTDLLRHALAVLGADTVVVTVAADARNQAALRLYERQGFRRCRLQDVYLWLGANIRP